MGPILDQFTGPFNSDFAIAYYGGDKFSQSFTSNANAKAAFVALHLKRIGSVPGNITVSIATMLGTYGDDSYPGTILSSGTLSANSIPTSPSWVVIPITPVSLTSGSRYTVYLQGPATGTGNFSNVLGISDNEYDGIGNNPAHPGNGNVGRTGWGDWSFLDFGFRVYAEPFTKTHTFDTSTVRGVVHTLDSAIREEVAPIGGSGLIWPGAWGAGYLGGQYGGFHSVSIDIEQEIDHTVDSVLRKILTKNHTINSLLRRQTTLAHTVDSYLLTDMVKTAVHTVDAKLLARVDIDHTIDTILKRTYEKSHDIDALLAHRVTTTHMVDTFLEHLKISLSHNVDTSLYKEGYPLPGTEDGGFWRPRYTPDGELVPGQWPDQEQYRPRYTQDGAFESKPDDTPGEWPGA